jgi:hypothetical protein
MIRMGTGECDEVVLGRGGFGQESCHTPSSLLFLLFTHSSCFFVGLGSWRPRVPLFALLQLRSFLLQS